MSFQECPTCAAKPGSPQLCDECLDNRGLAVALLDRGRTAKRVAELDAAIVKIRSRQYDRARAQEQAEKAAADANLSTALMNAYRALEKTWARTEGGSPDEKVAKRALDGFHVFLRDIGLVWYQEPLKKEQP